MNTKGYYLTRVTDPSQAIPGNTLFWIKDYPGENINPGETSNHNMLIVDVDENGNIYVNMHTPSAEYLAWSLNHINDGGYTRNFYTIDFAHNFEADNTQTHSCSLCGTTGNHDSDGEILFDDMWHYFTCSACGRTVGSEYHSLMYWGYYECTICDYNTHGEVR